MFYEKAVNNLSSEQRIIYVEKRVNNFLNNAEHKIILCRMLEIVYAENRFYECSKQIRIYSNNAAQFMLLVTTYLSTATMPLNFLFWWFFGLDLKSLYFTMKYLNK